MLKQRLFNSLPYFFLVILIVNSAFLSYKYWNFYYGGGLLGVFDCQDDCDSVMMSKYARIFAVPVPIYGLLYFSILTYLYGKHSGSRLFQAFLGLGLLAALSFVYILYFLLQMQCKFCLLSHLSLFAFAVSDYLRKYFLIKDRKSP